MLGFVALLLICFYFDIPDMIMDYSTNSLNFSVRAIWICLLFPQ